MPLKIQWVSVNATHCEVWRLLDLSGMTKSVRDSRNFTRAGFLYVNTNQVFSQRYRVEVGSTVLLELRFPNGRTRTQTIIPVPHRTGRQQPRQNTPTELNYRG